MSKQGRTQLVLGVLLIALGAWFLLDKTNPQLTEAFSKYTEWPFNMFLIGGAILVIGLATGQPGMAVPAAIVAGIGGIFYYQDLTKNYDSWSYMWTLIPGFVGFGTLIAGLLGEHPGRSIRHGLKLMVVSSVLFLVFGSLLGDLALLGNYGPPILLILLGLWVLGSGIYRTYKNQNEE